LGKRSDAESLVVLVLKRVLSQTDEQLKIQRKGMRANILKFPQSREVTQCFRWAQSVGIATQKTGLKVRVRNRTNSERNRQNQSLPTVEHLCGTRTRRKGDLMRKLRAKKERGGRRKKLRWPISQICEREEFVLHVSKLFPSPGKGEGRWTKKANSI